MRKGTSPKRIFLIGFMGSGKTSTGKHLSQLLGYRFADMDQLIEEREGMPIRAIFSEKGEDYFRALESGLLREFVDQEGLVVSCGGGIVTREENVELLSREEETVFIKDEPLVLFCRVGEDGNRPLASGGASPDESPEQRYRLFQQLYQSRIPQYERAARMTVTGTGKTPKQIAEEILEMPPLTPDPLTP